MYKYCRKIREKCRDWVMNYEDAPVFVNKLCSIQIYGKAATFSTEFLKSNSIL